MRETIAHVILELTIVLVGTALIIAVALIFASSYAFAQEGPDEATKIWALKRAYQLNGNSMVGNNRMIDLTGETLFARPVPLERLAAPAAAAEQPDLNMDDLRKFSRRANTKTDICARNGMHKVIYGDKWRCRK